MGDPNRLSQEFLAKASQASQNLAVLLSTMTAEGEQQKSSDQHFLVGLGYPQYVETFREFGFDDPEALREVDIDELVTIGIDALDADDILSRLATLPSRTAAAPAQPPASPTTGKRDSQIVPPPSVEAVLGPRPKVAIQPRPYSTAQPLTPSFTPKVIKQLLNSPILSSQPPVVCDFFTAQQIPVTGRTSLPPQSPDLRSSGSGAPLTHSASLTTYGDLSQWQETPASPVATRAVDNTQRLRSRTFLEFAEKQNSQGQVQVNQDSLLALFDLLKLLAENSLNEEEIYQGVPDLFPIVYQFRGRLSVAPPKPGERVGIINFHLPRTPEFQGVATKSFKINPSLPILKVLELICKRMTTDGVAQDYCLETLAGFRLNSEETLLSYGFGTLNRNWELLVVPESSIASVGFEDQYVELIQRLNPQSDPDKSCIVEFLLPPLTGFSGLQKKVTKVSAFSQVGAVVDDIFRKHGVSGAQDFVCLTVKTKVPYVLASGATFASYGLGSRFDRWELKITFKDLIPKEAVRTYPGATSFAQAGELSSSEAGSLIGLLEQLFLRSQDDLAAAGSVIESKDQAIADYEGRLDTLQEVMRQHVEYQTYQTSVIEQLKADAAATAEKNNALVSRLSNQIATQLAENTKLTGELAAARIDLAAKRTQVDSLTSSLTSLQETLAKAEELARNQKNRIQQLQSDMTDQLTSKMELAEELSLTKDNYTSMRAQHTLSEGLRVQTVNKLSALESQHKALQEKLEQEVAAREAERVASGQTEERLTAELASTRDQAAKDRSAHEAAASALKKELNTLRLETSAQIFELSQTVNDKEELLASYQRVGEQISSEAMSAKQEVQRLFQQQLQLTQESEARGNTENTKELKAGSAELVGLLELKLLSVGLLSFSVSRPLTAAAESQLTTDLNEARQAIESLTLACTSAEERLAKSEQGNKELTARLADRDRELSQERELVRTREEERGQLRAQLAAAQGAQAETAESLSQASKSLEQGKAREEKLERLLREQQELGEAAADRERRREAELATSSARLEESERSLSQVTEKHQAALQDVERLNIQLTNLTNQLANASSNSTPSSSPSAGSPAPSSPPPPPAPPKAAPAPPPPPSFALFAPVKINIPKKVVDTAAEPKKPAAAGGFVVDLGAVVSGRAGLKKAEAVRRGPDPSELNKAVLGGLGQLKKVDREAIAREKEQSKNSDQLADILYASLAKRWKSLNDEEAEDLDAEGTWK